MSREDYDAWCHMNDQRANNERKRKELLHSTVTREEQRPTVYKDEKGRQFIVKLGQRQYLD
ncbi:hypothetical protein AwEntero_28930 [Enterobacterales bacterium]|nr:hypothetical protein AwEntero_28930 [Enterobacterales bacterium]